MALFLFSLLFSLFQMVSLEGKYYSFISEPIDVVIPCCDKDLSTLDLCIEGIRAHGKDVRRIIVVSPRQLTDRAEWFDEKLYPFTKESLTKEIFSEIKPSSPSVLRKFKGRVGWVYQQFLKLYAPFVIPGISSNVLVLDSDTIFLRDVTFINDRGGAFFDMGVEFYPPYFVHAKKLVPGFQRVRQESGVCHHMLFQRAILEDLFDLVKSRHRLPFWKAACRCLDHEEILHSSLSEYEIYFHFALSMTNQVEVRPLKHKDIRDLREIEVSKTGEWDHVSCHTWLR